MSPISWIVIAVVFAVGLLLFGIGSAMLRSLREETVAAQGLTWPQLVNDALVNADAALRLDMIERLSIVGSSWSREILEQAQTQERDPAVRGAIDRALGLPMDS